MLTACIISFTLGFTINALITLEKFKSWGTENECNND
jgi:hypothetical protein